MAIIGRAGRVLYQIVAIDDQCDACGARDVLGICYGPRLPVICIECLKGAVMVSEFWTRVPGPAPTFTASQVRAIPPGGGA